MNYKECMKINNNSFLTIYATEEHIISIKFEENESSPNYLTHLALKQLKEYLKGQRETFDLPLRPNGSEFQKRVWRILSTIQFGNFVTYKEIAQEVGGGNYARAVGMACNKNPLPIIIPCHRVIGSNRSLTGYVGGIPLKKKLLGLENIKTD